MLWVQLFFKTGFWSKISGFQFKRGSCDHRGAPVTSDRWSIGGAPITSPKVTGAPKNLGLTTRRSHLLRRWRYQHRAEVTRAAPPKFATCSNFIPTVFRTTQPRVGLSVILTMAKTGFCFKSRCNINIV